MSEQLPLFLLHLLGFAGFLWLGLYALTRGDRKPVATLTGAAALATACFFLSGGLLAALSRDRSAIAVSRVTWWDAVVPIALWLHLSLRLNPRAWRAPWRIPVLWSAYGAAALLTLLGMATDVVRDYTTSAVLAGPAYGLYVAYLFVCTGCAAANFSRLMARTQRALGPGGAPAGAATGEPGTEPDAGTRSNGPAPELGVPEVRLLAVGALCFLLGAGYIALRVLLRLPWYELPGYVLLLAGLGAVGATVAVQGALLLGKDVRRDAVYSFTGLLILLALSLVAMDLLLGFDGAQKGIFALILAALITAWHTLHDVQRDWLDAAFFTPAVREERAAARSYADALATQPAGPHPDLATRKAFDDAVRRALTHLSGPTKLATTPLLNLTVMARAVAEQGLEDNRLNRAAALREMLLELLDGLRPQDETGRVTDDAWRYYNCLYYPYVRGISRRRTPTVLRQLAERRQRDGTRRGELEQVLEWLLHVDEDTFYKWQRRGSDTIAATLREREALAGGAVPEARPAHPPPGYRREPLIAHR